MAKKNTKLAMLRYMGSKEAIEKRKNEPLPIDPQSYKPKQLAADIASTTVKADDIPVAHTPEGGYKEFPAPILADCDEPLSEGAPDLRGVWRVYKGKMVEHVERIEQCGDRVIVTGGHLIHDMRCDGTAENGCHDVNLFLGEEIHNVASYENGRLNMRLPGKNTVVVTRYLDGDELVWRYGPFKNRFRRIEAPPEK
jgi:hypothetical protein